MYSKEQLRAILRNVECGLPALESVPDVPPVDGTDELVADLARQLLRPAARRRIYTMDAIMDLGDGQRVRRTYAAAAMSEARAREMVHAEAAGIMVNDFQNVTLQRNPWVIGDEPALEPGTADPTRDPVTGEEM